MARYGTEPYIEQTKWLAANKDNLKIPFVTHLGDIVDRATVTQEWDVASEAMKVLDDAKLPYSIANGNHDATQNPATELFPRYFPNSRAAAQATFGGRDASGLSEWHTFTAEGRKFLVLALAWPADNATIAWGKSVVEANPTLPVILTTHDLLAIKSDAVSPLETESGLRLWDELIKDHDQIFLTVNGHSHGSAHLRKTNAFGHSVDQIVWDYQMAYQGGNGYLGLIEFDFTNRRMATTVVSPWVRLKPKQHARRRVRHRRQARPEREPQPADRLGPALRRLPDRSGAGRGLQRRPRRRRQGQGPRGLRGARGRAPEAAAQRHGLPRGRGHRRPLALRPGQGRCAARR